MIEFAIAPTSTHFAAMSVIVGFLAVHVAMSLLVPRSLLAMLRGR